MFNYSLHFPDDQDLLLASIDTTSTTIEWALSELIKNPDIMKKVQKELESKVGMERMVDESDLESLEYLKMVVKRNPKATSSCTIVAPPCFCGRLQHQWLPHTEKCTSHYKCMGHWKRP